MSTSPYLGPIDGDAQPQVRGLSLESDPLLLLALIESMRLSETLMRSRSWLSPDDASNLGRSLTSRLSFVLAHCPISSQIRSEALSLQRFLNRTSPSNP